MTVLEIRNAHGQLRNMSLGSAICDIEELLVRHYERTETSPRDGDSVEYAATHRFPVKFFTWTPRGFFYGTKPSGEASGRLALEIDRAIMRGDVGVELEHARLVASRV